MHIADGGSEDVHAGVLDELSCLFRSGEPFRQVGRRIVNFRPCADIADSPSTSMEGLIAFSASRACLVWRTFSSKGRAERSKTMESNSALAASIPSADQCV